MKAKEAKARIKINKLLEAAGWRFFDSDEGPANIQVEANVKITKKQFDNFGEDFEKVKNGFIDFLLLDEQGKPFVVLEAKSEDKDPLVGKEQARKYEKYAFSQIMLSDHSAQDRLNLYAEGIEKMTTNPDLPKLFRDILRNAYIPYRDPETLNRFLKEIAEFSYEDSEELGNAFEYLLSIMGSQGDAGQFRTPRHIIDMMVEITAPAKNETILDPACGTAGFLISAYNFIKRANQGEDGKTTLTADDKNRMTGNFAGYDISPDMVRLSRVNMYLHGFTSPNISEYDTLTSLDKWGDEYDVSTRKGYTQK